MNYKFFYILMIIFYHLEIYCLSYLDAPAELCLGHRAIQYYNFEALKDALNDNLDINIRIDGMSMLEYACQRGQYETIELLVMRGAEINSKKICSHSCNITIDMDLRKA